MHRISARHLLIELAVAFALLTGIFATPLKAAPGPYAGQAGGPGTTIPTTQLTDTVYHADGTTATGTVLVSWPAFTTSTGQAVPSGNTSVTIATGGLVSLTLVPNADSNPMGSYYTAVYHLDDGTVSREYWVVPVSSTAVTIASIKSTVLPASVAVQTVTKSYVDSAIAAAVNAPQTSTLYVMKAGDTMTGPLLLPADPVSPSQAADKHYVDTSVAALGGGSGGKVALAPSASQVVAQPTGTALSVNRLNGVEYASQIHHRRTGQRHRQCDRQHRLRRGLRGESRHQLHQHRAALPCPMEQPDPRRRHPQGRTQGQLPEPRKRRNPRH